MKSLPIYRTTQWSYLKWFLNFNHEFLKPIWWCLALSLLWKSKTHFKWMLNKSFSQSRLLPGINSKILAISEKLINFRYFKITWILMGQVSPAHLWISWVQIPCLTSKHCYRKWSPAYVSSSRKLSEKS